MADLKLILEDTDDKVLVFSQWTSWLDMLHEPLRKSGVEFVRVDGSRSLEEREAAIHQFTLSDEPRVMLLSLMAAAYGLNLCKANHVWRSALHHPQARVGPTLTSCPGNCLVGHGF